jgi:hypothetical protein
MTSSPTRRGVGRKMSAEDRHRSRHRCAARHSTKLVPQQSSDANGAKWINGDDQDSTGTAQEADSAGPSSREEKKEAGATSILRWCRTSVCPNCRA